MDRGIGVLLLVLMMVSAGEDRAVAAVSPDSFYAGKTVNILVGFGPGGENDVWARIIAKHLVDHLPGRPRIVVQNSPGAGSLKLINQLYNVSPRDGTVIGLVSRGLPLEPLLGGEGTQFDPLKMNWLGSPDRDTTVCVARKDAQVKTLNDLFSKPLLVGATGSGADTAIYPDFLSELLGMKFKTVKGYQGLKEITLAMERKEVEGICAAHDSLMRSALARAGQVNILFQAALTPDPRLKNIPVGADLARSDADRQALQLFFARVALGRPFVAPPGVPPARVAILRQAFDDTMKDPGLIADAKRQDLNPGAITGAELAELIAAAYKTPKTIVERTTLSLSRARKGG
jgi:tripartite-type tricarboxylate transporter receptor subunit TctC